MCIRDRYSSLEGTDATSLLDAFASLSSDEEDPDETQPGLVFQHSEPPAQHGDNPTAHTAVGEDSEFDQLFEARVLMLFGKCLGPTGKLGDAGGAAAGAVGGVLKMGGGMFKKFGF